jgi:hypothetical protein
MAKQIDFVESKLVQWKSLVGPNSHNLSDLQGAFMAAIDKAQHVPETCIEDVDPI